MHVVSTTAQVCKATDFINAYIAIAYKSFQTVITRETKAVGRCFLAVMRNVFRGIKNAIANVCPRCHLKVIWMRSSGEAAVTAYVMAMGTESLMRHYVRIWEAWWHAQSLGRVAWNWPSSAGPTHLYAQTQRRAC